MIRHIVMWKFRPGTEAQAREFMEKLSALYGVIPQIRQQQIGVDCSGSISNLVQKGLIEEKGRLDLPGRPLVYGTTDRFLRCFSLSSLDDLPDLPNHEEENKENGQTTLFDEEKNDTMIEELNKEEGEE